MNTSYHGPDRLARNPSQSPSSSVKTWVLEITHLSHHSAISVETMKPSAAMRVTAMRPAAAATFIPSAVVNTVYHNAEWVAYLLHAALFLFLSPGGAFVVFGLRFYVSSGGGGSGRGEGAHDAPVDDALVAAPALRRRRAMAQTPALIKAYLRIGGFVGEGAYIDHAFNTTDVCLILDTARINEAQRALYTKGRGQ